jgi:hypothetical protein
MATNRRRRFRFSKNQGTAIAVSSFSVSLVSAAFLFPFIALLFSPANHPPIIMPTPVQSGVPSHLVREDGAYNLVAAIDGPGANKQFIANLQVINAQRQALGELTRKLTALPKNTPSDERAQLSKRAGEIEAGLVKNMEFMTKSYGYSIHHNYLLIPLKANILEKSISEDGKPSEDESLATLVKSIESSQAYEHFEALRAAYARESREGGDPALAQDAAEQLLSDYGFKVQGNYILQISKGALYASTH